MTDDGWTIPQMVLPRWLLRAICWHPARLLQVWGGYQTKKVDDDFSESSFRMRCSCCGTQITMSYAELNGGVEGFMKRGKGEMQ